MREATEKTVSKIIKIKYLRDIQKLERFCVGDWIDLRAAEDVTMKAGEYRRIPLGIAMELPAGYEAFVVKHCNMGGIG